MKRSEMIKKLSEPIVLGNVDLHLWSEEAEAILSRMEGLGMLPPRITDVPEERVLDLGKHKWEPEDEE